MVESTTSRFAQARAEPGKALRVLMELLRGKLAIWRCHLLGRRVECGRNLRITAGGRLRLQGPGRVVFGDDVTIGETVTPWTSTPEAVITVGNRVLLNGTRFGCHASISVGDRCLLGDCRLMDSDFHGTDPNARERYEAAPVAIGENVWIAIGVIVLKGVTIGTGSTVSAGSIVTGDLPGDSICWGNPAKVLKSALREPPARSG
ncbi:MAG: acyltransferase [Planctomycetes bacterium]|nr:acyltransferase [Planctomycetota bacterium]